jgi:hypothetical protein
MSEHEIQAALKLLSEKSAQYVAERKINRVLVEALKDARLTIQALHGPIAWDIYEKCSPEMKRIDGALKQAGTP